MHWMGALRGTTTRARLPGAADASAQAPAALTTELLQERYLDDVFRYVARRVFPAVEAEDITAEVFAAAFAGLNKRKPRTLAGSGDAAKAWLLGIARRKVADAIRRRKRRGEIALDDPDLAVSLGARTANAPQEAVLHDEAMGTLRALVNHLPTVQREVLLLKYVDGLSTNEVAIVIGRSPAAANSLLQRARAAVFAQGRAYFLMDEKGENR